MKKTLPFSYLCLASAILLAALSGCSSVATGDKIDYRSGSAKTNPLEVPPDLTLLARDGRFRPQGGAISAVAQQSAAASAPAAAGSQPAIVAPTEIGDLRIERQGAMRWLVTGQSPEQLWPRLRDFWLARGFVLKIDTPEAGVMETDWAENRAKIPSDIIRNTIGKAIDSLYSTGERDKFRTRVERTAQGSEIFITHRGLEEVFIDRDHAKGTVWTNRPSDPGLEAEFLARLMTALGVREDAARTAVAQATSAADAPPKARLLADAAGTVLQVDDAPERAWRRVGLALDRGGFTIEERNRDQWSYDVRYVDAGQAEASQPGFFSRLFGGSKTDASAALQRFLIQVAADGSRSVVSVLNDKGQPDTSAQAKRIASILLDELKF